jgi:hypothetical protein
VKPFWGFDAGGQNHEKWITLAVAFGACFRKSSSASCAAKRCRHGEPDGRAGCHSFVAAIIQADQLA